MSKIKMPAFNIRLDEQQLLEMAAKARVQSSKKSYLHKSDPKLKRLTQRWCCIYQNMLFYFESESVPKPLGVVLLEGCTCKPVEQAGQPSIEGAFYISTGNGEGHSNGKIHYFIAKNNKERNDWIEVLSNSNMSRQRQELEETRARCEEFYQMVSTRNSEVEHLKQANLIAQKDIEHLRGALQCTTLLSRNRSSCSSSFPSTSESPDALDQTDHSARVIQRFLRSCLTRSKWRRLVRDYMSSSLSETMKKRNQLMWKFVASEEDYVSQLTTLNEEYRQHLEIAAVSQKPPLTLRQANCLFRNSNELLLLHQLLLRGLHSAIEKWPVVVFGDVLKLFTPMFHIYHKYIGDQSHANEILLSLLSETPFREHLESLQERPRSNNLTLESLLMVPLKRIASYIQDLQELCALTVPEHVDYVTFTNTISELESIQKMVTDEVTQNENIREVLKLESMMEGGCRELLDKEQALVRQGILQQVRSGEDKPSISPLPRTANKLRSQPRHCFLLTKHLLITTRTTKKPHDCYRITKILPLLRCSVSEYQKTSEIAELVYRAIKVNYDLGSETESTVLLSSSINEKAEWIADITQCVENEKQNKILQSQSIGEPVELSSRFIRYSTFRTGKEQLVNSGNLDSLLERLVKISHFGLDFLNTFLMTFPLYTNAHTVYDFLEKNYWECLQSRERRRGSISPHEAVRDARAIQSQSFPRSVAPPPNSKRQLNVPSKHWSLPPTRKISTSSTGSVEVYVNGIIQVSPAHDRRTSTTSTSSTSSSTLKSVSGVLFALKHWICKHFYHFREDQSLADKLENLIEHANNSPYIQPNERTAAQEVSSMYHMQKTAHEELSPVMQLKLSKEQVYLPQKPFECVLLWNPRETAEQLCLIEGALFQRVGNDEILRYFTTKGEAKAKASPNLTAIFEHFNRMSLFFMWSMPSQRYFVDRVKTLEFLIQLAWECYQYNNFSSLMQLTSALEHGSTARFKAVWEHIPKPAKVQFQQLVQLSSTDNRFKELRNAMKKAPPPTVPYLGILLSEVSSVVEGLPTYVEEHLVNFSKMRRCVRLITGALHHQKDPYEFPYISEVCKVLLHTPIPGNEDDLYKFVDSLEDK